MRAYSRPLVLALALLATPAAAASPAPQDQLKQNQDAITQAKAAQAKLQAENAEIESELSNLQAQLVKLAGTAQRSENELSGAEDKLRILTRELDAKTKEFKSRQEHLSSLVQAAISLSHTPPEAMIMMPGDVTRTMKAARALKMASESVKAETQSLGLQLAELQKLKDKVSKDRDAMADRQKTLASQQQDLVQKLAERKTLQKRLGNEADQNAQALASLAQKTKDLEELVENVEHERAAAAEEERARESQRKKATSHSFADAKGHIRSPVSGKVTQKFGESEGKNATAKGLTVATRAHASVTAPFDGEVVFTGPFLKYGQMVIIHHSDNFHTLLAGLQKIDVEVGQFLLEGEPIGAMGDDAQGNELYVELRKDNQPIDPAPWMSALSRKK